jgi:hypothetical protein
MWACGYGFLRSQERRLDRICFLVALAKRSASRDPSVSALALFATP